MDNDLQKMYLKKLQDLLSGDGSSEGGAPDVFNACLIFVLGGGDVLLPASR